MNNPDRCNLVNPKRVRNRAHSWSRHFALFIISVATTTFPDEPVRIACYGQRRDGDPLQNTDAWSVFCDPNTCEVRSWICEKKSFSPPNPIPEYCEQSPYETGEYCIPTNSFITVTELVGSPQCVYEEGATNRCRFAGQCVNIRPFTNYNYELPRVNMTREPFTNTVCR